MLKNMGVMVENNEKRFFCIVDDCKKCFRKNNVLDKNQYISQLNKTSCHEKAHFTCNN